MKSSNIGVFFMLLATLFWGASYLFMHQGLVELSPWELIALRFGIGFIAASAIFCAQFRQVTFSLLRDALLLGTLLALCFYAVMRGLETTATGMAGVLLGGTVIFVQINQALLQRRLPSLSIAVAALLAFGGIAVITYHGKFLPRTGNLWCLASAYGYSWHIVWSGAVLKRQPALPFGVLQLGMVTVAALAGMVWCGAPIRIPHQATTWGAILFLGLGCSAGGFLLQALAQTRISADRIGVLFAMEPAFALLLGISIRHEPCTLIMLSGCGAILAGVLLSQISFHKAI